MENKKVTVSDLNIDKKFYHKDKEKQETTLVGIEYAKVTFYTDEIQDIYEFLGEYVIELKHGRKIEVSKEDYENVKSNY